MKERLAEVAPPARISESDHGRIFFDPSGTFIKFVDETGRPQEELQSWTKFYDFRPLSPLISHISCMHSLGRNTLKYFFTIAAYLSEYFNFAASKGEFCIGKRFQQLILDE